MDATTSVRVVIASVGPSGTAPILVETAEDEDDQETGDTKAHHEGQLPITYLPDDTVVLGAPIKKRGIRSTPTRSAPSSVSTNSPFRDSVR